MKNVRSTVLALFALVVPVPAVALDPLPKEHGWNGYVNVGLGGTLLKSNLIAGNGLVEIGEDEIDSLGQAPDAETDPILVFNGQLGYFWAEKKVLVKLGNSIENLARYEFQTIASVQKGFDGGDIVDFSILGTGIATEVWADPYVAGMKRDETDRTATGFRFTWDRILGSGLEIEASSREIEIDDELSGTNPALGLTLGEQALLAREGDHTSFRVSYRFRIGDRHQLIPRLRASDYDLDGAAMSNDVKGVDLTYGYRGDGWTLLASAYLGKAEYDATHPIYEVEREDDGASLTVTLAFPGLLPGDDWSLLFSAARGAVDSNIPFYDSRVSVASVSAFYHF
jgi:hypothetical protein